MELIDDFRAVRIYTYKGERYSVRDNGAVMWCCARVVSCERKLDNELALGVKEG